MILWPERKRGGHVLSVQYYYTKDTLPVSNCVILATIVATHPVIVHNFLSNHTHRNLGSLLIHRTQIIPDETTQRKSGTPVWILHNIWAIGATNCHL